MKGGRAELAAKTASSSSALLLSRGRASWQAKPYRDMAFEFCAPFSPLAALLLSLCRAAWQVKPYRDMAFENVWGRVYGKPSEP